MNEKVLQGKKNGMVVLLGVLLLGALGILGIVFAGVQMNERVTPFAVFLLVISILVTVCAPILLGGLKVLRPQEALVLTLFGNYVGTLKEEGFYFVNPFCSAVNPAAKTKLNQSGDVDGGNTMQKLLASGNSSNV